MNGDRKTCVGISNPSLAWHRRVGAKEVEVRLMAGKENHDMDHSNRTKGLTGMLRFL
jgi:hypothetical protein